MTREYKSISENPPPYITAHPSESNILECVAPDSSICQILAYVDE